MTYYWISNIPGNWSNPNNWSPTDGGLPNGNLPSENDDVFFSSANGICTVDAHFVVKNLTKSNAAAINFLPNMYCTIQETLNINSGAVNVVNAILTVNTINLSPNCNLHVNYELYAHTINGSTVTNFNGGSATINVYESFNGPFAFGLSTVETLGENVNLTGNAFYNLITNAKTNLHQNYVNVQNLKVHEDLVGPTTNLIINNLSEKIGEILVNRIDFLGDHNQNFLPTTYESKVQFANFSGTAATITFAPGIYTFLNGLNFSNFGANTIINLVDVSLNIHNGFIGYSQNILEVNITNSNINLHGPNNFFQTDTYLGATLNWNSSNVFLNVMGEFTNPSDVCKFEKICTVVDQLVIHSAAKIYTNDIEFQSINVEESGYLFVEKSNTGSVINILGDLYSNGIWGTTGSSFTINVGGNANFGPAGEAGYIEFEGIEYNLALNVAGDLSIIGLSDFEPLPLMWKNGYALSLTIDGEFEAEYVVVKNVNVINRTVSGNNCVDLGGNYNWDFGLIPSISLLALIEPVPVVEDVPLTAFFNNFNTPNVIQFYLAEEGQPFNLIQSFSTQQMNGTRAALGKLLKPATKYVWYVVITAIGQSPVTSVSQTFKTTDFPAPVNIIERAASHSNFPKLANQCQSGGSDDRNLAVLDNLHYWDLAIVDSASLVFVPEYLGPFGILRQRNPNIVLLSYFSPDIPTGITIDPNTPTGSYIANLNSEFKLKTISGEPVNFWFNGTTYNHVLNFANEQARQYFVQHVNNSILSQPYFDGVFYDWAATEISNLSHSNNNQPIDLNNDGTEETDIVVDHQWAESYVDSLELAQNTYPQNTIIAGNAGGWTGLDYAEYMHGIMIERFQSEPNILPEKNSWAAQMRVYGYYSRFGKKPNFSFLMVNDNNSKNYQLMRFGLCSALMFDGYFCFTNNDGAYWSTRWYDEYSVNIKTRQASRDLKYKGYLGKPISQAYNFNNHAELLSSTVQIGQLSANDKVWVRKFENGIVIVNPSSATAELALDKTYYRIKGSVDKSFNNGLPTNSVLLQPKSGIILLN